MLEKYKVVFYANDNGTTEEQIDYFPDIATAILNWYTMKMIIISNITHFIADRSSENVEWSLKLIDLEEGLVRESFKIKLNQNFNEKLH